MSLNFSSNGMLAGKTFMLLFLSDLVNSETARLREPLCLCVSVWGGEGCWRYRWVVAKLSSLNTIVWSLTGQVYTDNARQGQILQTSNTRQGGRLRLLQDQDQIKLWPTWDTTFPPDNFQPTSPPYSLILNITNISLALKITLAGWLKALAEIDNEASDLPPLLSRLEVARQFIIIQT